MASEPEKIQPDYINQLFNEDCITGCQNRIPDNSIDLIITDPPYGINGDTLHKHYNRKESFVLNGYTEVPLEDYRTFSQNWINQAERILKPGGSIYIVSGYTNLIHILNALHKTDLVEMNHLIWKYNFGVYTKQKYVSSHYHILFYIKKGKKHTFNTHCRYGSDERDDTNGSLNYQDREDVWIINKEYKPAQLKNKNELPTQLLTKIIQYSSNVDDLVCDLFLGGFSTAITAYELGRNVCGFELNQVAFEHNYPKFKNTTKGNALKNLKKPEKSIYINQNKKWTDEEIEDLKTRYFALKKNHCTKEQAIQTLTKEFGRGRFAITNIIKKFEQPSKNFQTETFPDFE